MPRLFERGEGILETHITLRDIEDVISEQLHCDVKLSDETEVTRIGDDDGYNSVVALVEPKWIGAAPSQIERKFVVKIAANPDPQAFLARALKSDEPFDQYYEDAENTFRKESERELYFFELYAKHNWSIKVPKFFGCRKFSPSNPMKCFAILEAVDGFVIDRYDQFNVEESKEVLRELAKFHAFTYQLDEAEKLKLPSSVMACYIDPCSEENIIELINKWNHFPDMKELIDKIVPMMPSIHGIERMWHEHERLGIDNVMIHGDFWNGNMLFGKETPQRMLKAFLDFQYVHMGAASVDLSAFTTSCLDGQYRKDNWLDVLKYYYEVFVEESGTNKIPFTFDQLVDSYCYVYPTMALVMTDLYTRDPSETEEQKKIADDKVRWLLKDAIYFGNKLMEN